MLGDLPKNIARTLRSQKFFYVILGLFCFESLWLAITAVYPMVFDENTHFGIIKLYAQQWSPIFAHQPAGGDFAGALQHNPSFLYEYLMSFPYRVLTHLTSNVTAQIITLRIINIALFALAVVIIRRLLLKIKIRPAAAHLTLFCFIMVPVVPLLAAQLNYDNLVLPVTSLLLLLSVEFIQKLRRSVHISVLRPGAILALGMFGCMVQYEVLPFFIAILTGLAVAVILVLPRPLHDLRLLLLHAAQHTAKKHLALLAAALLVTGFLFSVSYGYNVVVLHNPNPSCSQTLPKARCAANITWARDEYNKHHPGAINKNPVLFAGSWTYRMLLSMFYTSSGGAPGVMYLSFNPLPILFVGSIAVAVGGLALAGFYVRRLAREYPELGFLLFITGFYLLSLLIHNFAAYHTGGQKIGINGRYAFPVLFVILATAVLGYQQFLAHRPTMGAAGVLVVLLLCTQGGGFVTYLVASDSRWYWQNHIVISLNKAAQKAVKPVVIFERPIGAINLSGDPGD